MTIAIGIVAHTARQTHAEQLAAQVNADFTSFDDGTLGCNANHKAVYRELADIGAEWSCVLEDDVHPVINMRGQLDHIINAAPSPIISIYLGKLRPPQYQARIGQAIQKAKENDCCFILADRLFNAVGVLMRTELIPDMLNHLKTYLPIDENIGQWARRRKLPVAYTMPSIIEHLDGPTLVKHRDGQPRTPGRVAWTLGTRRHWTDQAVTL